MRSKSVMITLVSLYYLWCSSSDPVQLNLLYEQSRKAIKIGAHPVEMKIARQLAAFMLQMIYGDHNEAKHIPEKIE